jgi:electron-transferring-flavoprotein dehydrogenase
MRQAFVGGFWRGSLSAGLATVTRGRVPCGDRPTERDAEQELFVTDRASRYPAPDGKLTFDKLSSVFLSGNRTRDDQPSHIRVQAEVPRTLAELWVRMCPAQVYEVAGAAGGGGGDGESGGAEGEGVGADVVTVSVTPSNCVQCGAITAKGGRLTPPEGGSGPEYTLT